METLGCSSPRLACDHIEGLPQSFQTGQIPVWMVRGCILLDHKDPYATREKMNEQGETFRERVNATRQLTA